MLFDSHLHTRFSADSEMEAAEAVAAAERIGVGLVFTEHLDFSYPGELEFMFDPWEYWRTYEPIRGKNLCLGVEAGLAPGETERLQAFLASVPFDEVIGSIHLVDGKDLYERTTYEGLDQTEMYGRYFTLMADMVRSNPFIDVLGHVDYIARYAPYKSPAITYDRWSDEIDDVLRSVIETDTVLEINTRRFRDEKVRQELIPIYRRYRELGGKMVTLGSDAHSTEGIAAHFSAAQDFAEAIGLQVVTFRDRRVIKTF